jgi:hypothetical protein
VFITVFLLICLGTWLDYFSVADFPAVWSLWCFCSQCIDMAMAVSLDCFLSFYLISLVNHYKYLLKVVIT